MTRTLIPALALTAVFATPALAISGVADVPSLWPAEGAFETPVTRDTATPLIAPDNTAEISHPADEQKGR